MPLGDSLNSLRLPDLWQQDAIRHLKAGRDVIVDAPTGAGKTLVFEALVDGRALKGQAVYTVPTRALANDKRAEWSRRGWQVGIATGELAEKTDAPVLVATLETQRERLIAGNGPALMVVDEYQMLADPMRGLSYELALSLAPKRTQLLLLSGSVANPAEVQAWLGRLGRDCALVSTKDRPVPLEEMPLESLPGKAPAQVSGFWPRLAAEVLLADLGPLLIFAPRRSMAEKIARQIAGALPADDPLELGERQFHACGKDLAAVLAKRVAWHHSGLGFQARAGVIEPLAKAGKLRVVVATTGLAAGINFSMRSVIVAETRYFDGRHERELTRDELLQMFGRAGRRGLDETGYVITSRTSPRPGDAAQVRLRRSPGLDWPPMLRVMAHAAERGESPLEAARRVADSLFTTEKIDLGLDPEAVSAPASVTKAAALFNLGPTRLEVRNSRGEWEPRDPARLGTATLGEAVIVENGVVTPALASPTWLQQNTSVGRVTRLAETGRFGRELALGHRAEGRRMISLTKQLRQWLGRRDPIASLGEFEEPDTLAALAPHFDGGRPAGMVLRGELWTLLLDFAGKSVPVYRDAAGVPLLATEERSESDASALDLHDPATGRTWRPPGHTPAHFWRRLGLIESDGTPTRRGVIGSFFHQGEGLAVAAALEDAALPIDELIILLANIRAGSRFGESLTGHADRLAYACHEAYGVLDFEGSLSLGLPTGYGLGAAERVAEFLADPHHVRRRHTDETVGEGDIERAVIEWLSLLRHIAHAPDHPWDRWQALKSAAAAHLRAAEPHLPSRTLPEVPAAQLTHRVDHHLRPGMFRKA